MSDYKQSITAASPIGVFDSGVGGTSIWKEIVDLLPNESSIYLADSKNAPYGVKSKEKIIELCVKNTELLLSKGCKIIVVACNTATTNAIKTLREKYTVPFIGIEPAIKPALLNSKRKTIGILATKGTLSTELFHKTSSIFKSDMKVVEQDGSGIVKLIESGKLFSKEMEELLESKLVSMVKAEIDHLVLGCSHYPYLIPILKKLLPEDVVIVDSGLAVAKQTKAVLKENNLLNTNESSKHQFYTNADKRVLEQILEEKYNVEELDF